MSLRSSDTATHHTANRPPGRDSMSNTEEHRQIIAQGLGSVLTAMVTPFDSEENVDLDAVARLARSLTEPGRNDGIVVNGTTGESISTTESEKHSILAAAVEAVAGTGAKVIAGVGSGDTGSSVALARSAAAAGADGLLVVAPYYSRPNQAGLLRHFMQIADSTDLPVMLYDIPARSGVAIEHSTFVAASVHPNIVAVKDAKGDLESSSWVMRETPLAYYSGDDALNLPLLSLGAVGFVSVVGHVVAERLRMLLELHRAGKGREALAVHQELLPVYRGMFRQPAAASVKAALELLGDPASTLRGPMVGLTAAQRDVLSNDLLQAAVGIPAGAGVRSV